MQSGVLCDFPTTPVTVAVLLTLDLLMAIQDPNGDVTSDVRCCIGDPDGSAQRVFIK